MANEKLTKKKALNCLNKCVDLELELDVLYLAIPEKDSLLKNITKSIEDLSNIKESLKKMI